MPDSVYTESNAQPDSPSALNTILLTGLVAGTMDILGAIIVYAGIYGIVSAMQIVQLIASGILGKDAFAGGTQTAILGLALHYFIAFSWTIIYFLMFPYIPFLRKQKIISGLLYGVVVWIIMNLGVLPLSRVNQAPFNWSGAIVGAAILMVCIGLPISLLVSRYYAAKIR